MSILANLVVCVSLNKKKKKNKRKHMNETKLKNPTVLGHINVLRREGKPQTKSKSIIR